MKENVITINPYAYPGIKFDDARDWLDVRKRATKDQVIKSIEHIYDRSFNKILTGKKRYPHSEARLMIYFVLHKKLGYSQTKTGKIVEKHRSTVAHGVKRFQKKLRSNKKALSNLQKVEIELLDHIRK